jgi:hypothetical protein
MANWDDLKKGFTPQSDAVPICLRGDLAARYERLERELAEARDEDAQDSLAAGGQTLKIAREMEDLRGEMLQHTHHFQFKALPKSKYRDLVADHRPRDGDPDDAQWGANLATFPQALIQACCTDPVMTVEQVEEMCGMLSDGQVVEMFGCAVRLNRENADIPKSLLASEVLARHAPRSKRPAPGGSPAAGSSAGSLAG